MEYPKAVISLLLLTSFLVGCHVATGPVIAYAHRRGLAYGWELGGGHGPLLRGNIGGSYRPNHDNSGMEHVHYAVAEPWLVMGGTVGIALVELDRFDSVVGIWEAFAFNPDKNDPGIFGHCSEGESSNFPQLSSESFSLDEFVISFAIGYRNMAGVREVYFTPKVGMMDCFPHIHLTSQ